MTTPGQQHPLDLVDNSNGDGGDGPDMAEPGLGAVLVLLARRARRRDPSATVWTVVSYDPHARVPVADIARRWEPAGTAAGRAGTVPEPVARWLGTVLGRDVSISVPADDLAGPDSWHVQPRIGTGPASRAGSVAID